MDFNTTIGVATKGLKAESTRLRVIAENLANANSTAPAAGELPYRRKVVTFKDTLDKTLGADTVSVKKIDVDSSDFQRRFDPGNPAADADGYVKMPNVNPLVEAMDMREAERSYEADLNVVEAARTMQSKTVALLS